MFNVKKKPLYPVGTDWIMESFHFWEGF